MSEHDVLMPIGRFARSCRLSVKALRHYDEIGILPPAFIDVGSGYRYYARRQARDAVAISLLRSLGIPLPTVGAILAGSPEHQQSLLGEEAGRLAEELRQRTEALRAIQRLLREGTLLPYTVQVRQEPAMTVAECASTTTPERLAEDTLALVTRLLNALRTEGRSIVRPVMSLIEEPDSTERVAVRVCARIEPPCSAIAGLELVDLPAGPVAWVLHRGPYEEVHIAYHALHAWLLEHGHQPAGPIREIYRNDPAIVAPENLETEVLLPIADF
jgi:DNA-binding transcriptional MerR regulator